ncbi:MAG: hypothetical protein QOF13_1610 [Solirubrobacterales bacterium]|jgi:hypothetical protein|nr:hypothetical protein [Solirubrobacterales bacterium]
MSSFVNLEALPGAGLIQRGAEDLDAGHESAEALLVSIGAPRLRSVGIELSSPIPSPEHKLYPLLAGEKGDAAHSAYNALIRPTRQLRAGGRVRELADSTRIERFMRELGRAAAWAARHFDPVAKHFRGCRRPSLRPLLPREN